MNQIFDEDEVLTPKEVSRLYKTSKPWPYQAARRGLLPYHKLGDKLIRFKKSDVQNFFEASRIEKQRTKA